MGNSVSVVICVHNGLEDVQRCLESVHESIENREDAEMIVVDDGSDPPTRDYLARWCPAHAKKCRLLVHEEARGYTKAANHGLSESDADHLVLLNSDTIVGRSWIDGMLRCCSSDSKIGMVGPLSNAASYQSVPERFDSKGDWAINDLPNGVGVDEFNEFVFARAEPTYPRVPILNGFCLLITRALIDAIGKLDETNFPQGYGEENDYCLRAASAGFGLAVVDDVYVFHAKSKSFGHERRRRLSKQGQETLRRIHGRQAIEDAVKQLRESTPLANLRERVKARDASLQKWATSGNRPRIVFLLPARGGGGGVHSVVQEVWGMRCLGVDASIAVPSQLHWTFRRHYPFATNLQGFFVTYKDESDLASKVVGANVLIATTNRSVQLAKQICDRSGALLGYYVQDYEPWFYPEGSEARDVATQSYELASEGILFAKTQWLCDTVREKHALDVRLVRPSIDTTVYRPTGARALRGVGEPISICAMIRPQTPRRSPEMTLRLLKEAKETFGDQIEIHTFGDYRSKWPKRWLFGKSGRAFEHHRLGPITREQVAGLLQSCHIFLDLSAWQAFGRTGLEAMACGVATVLPTHGGVHEYAEHERNSLVVDTRHYEECRNALWRYVEDPGLLEAVQTEAMQTAAAYSITNAALSEVRVLIEEWNRRNRHRPFSMDLYPQLKSRFGRTDTLDLV